MAQKRTAQQLRDKLLVDALGRSGHPLRPYPADAPAEELDAAIGVLRDRGHVHGPRHEPNLTLAGRDVAREIEEHTRAAKADVKGNAA